MMGASGPLDIAAAVAKIPRGLFVMTSAFEHSRSGVLVKWVQRCSSDPPLIIVAVPKGQPVEPLIRDSRSFALCQIAEDDAYLFRKFAQTHDRADDPFVALDMRCGTMGAPIIERAMSYLDCEVVRHLELDADHRLYIGQVITGGILHHGKPAIHWDENGYHNPPRSSAG
jgi:flavin reductase (DIM6/NTAB) family NADH-FMN oxidoreductase RutF